MSVFEREPSDDHDLSGRAIVVLLTGPPAAGKLTVGRALVARLGTTAVLLDNHRFSDPILALVRADGVSPLPREVWGYVGRIKQVVLEAAEELAPPDTSFIFTNYLAPGEADAASFERTEAFSRRRGAVFVPVALQCPEEELARRVGNEDRASRGKLLSPEILRSTLAMGVWVPEHENLLILSSADHDAPELADRILHHAATLARWV